MNIKVNVPILHKKTGDIVTPQDSDYLQFQAWADNKDRKWGQGICEEVPDDKPEVKEEVVIPEEKTEDVITEIPTEEVPETQPKIKEFKCDVEGCGKIFGSPAAIRMHKMNGHKAATPEESNGD